MGAVHCRARMREVSCKVFDPFFRAADARGLPRAALLAGVGYSLSHLTDRNERVEWDAYRRFMVNVAARFTDDEIVRIGSDGLASPLVRSILVVGRVLLSAPGFYRWVVSAGGAGNLLFANVVPAYIERGPDRFALELRMAPGYPPCREFFLFAQGGFEGMPRALGLADATVERVEIPDGTRFEIRVPQRGDLRGRVSRLLTRRRDARVVASELDDAMQALEARYAELARARNEVEQQRAVLDLAYRVGHAIWGERDPGAVGAVVARSLVEVAGFAGAEVEVAAAGDAGALAAAHGDADAGEALDVDLTTHRLHGRLRVRIADAAGEAQARTLLALLTPTVALALDNAFAYRELATYQHELERLVEDRTAELAGARDALAGSVDRLREAQAARGRFFAAVSHELRTPLTLIQLAVADVEARAAAALDAAARGDLGAIGDGARKLQRLVDELLLLAAGEATALRLAPEPTDVVALVAQIAAAWRLAAEHAGLTLAVEAPPDARAVVDPVALERVVTNLIANAVKFTPPGGRVTLAVGTTPAEVAITVSDTGPGIPDELMPRLFGRFERGQGGGGTGLGLSLVKQLVEAHGGAVVARRAPGGGAELAVMLPRGAGAGDGAARPAALGPVDFGVPERDDAAAVASGDELGPAGPAVGTVLVAEDEPRLAAMIARLLSDEHRVVVALDGAAALELARQHQPHVLVTDVDMPGLDGLELARRFREVTGDALASVVILSALADPGTRLAGFEAGAVDYVVKPFDPRELRARVGAQFRMRELAVRLQRAEQLSALGTLSAGLAHELRNPANGIINAVPPLRRLLPEELIRPDTTAGQLLDVLAGCAEQVAFVSRHLLGFHRGGALELRTVALGDVVRRAHALAQPQLDGVELRAAFEPSLPVRCAPPLLVQVLTNLLVNAGQAVGRGGWVEVAAARRGDALAIEVGDSGPGVPPALRERVFEPFFTTKPPGDGLGLGLALARDIVHRHGGTLDIRDRGDRAVFVIELPAVASPAGVAAA